jgi:hypothetical protein
MKFEDVSEKKVDIKLAQAEAHTFEETGLWTE